MSFHADNMSEADFMDDGGDYVIDDYENDDGHRNGYEYHPDGGVTIFIRYGETEDEAFERFIKDSSRQKVWQMKNGKRIHVSKMTISHLKNTINMLKNKSNAQKYQPWIDTLQKELDNRKNSGFALYKG